MPVKKKTAKKKRKSTYNPEYYQRVKKRRQRQKDALPDKKAPIDEIVDIAKQNAENKIKQEVESPVGKICSILSGFDAFEQNKIIADLVVVIAKQRTIDVFNADEHRSEANKLHNEFMRLIHYAEEASKDTIASLEKGKQ